MQQPVTGASQGRLINANHELLAFGFCEMQNGGDITMRVTEEHVAAPHKAQGDLTLLLDDGRAVAVSNRFIRLQLRGEANEARTIYRMHAVR